MLAIALTGTDGPVTVDPSAGLHTLIPADVDAVQPEVTGPTLTCSVTTYLSELLRLCATKLRVWPPVEATAVVVIRLFSRLVAIFCPSRYASKRYSHESSLVVAFTVNGDCTVAPLP